MNKIIKFAVGAAILGPALIASSAFASANTTQVTLNGGPNATVPMGHTAQGNVNYTLTSGTDVESFSYQIVDNIGNAALPPICIDATDHTTAGVYNSSFTVGTGGQTEGTWAIKIRLYGDTGVGVDNQCNRPSDLLDTFTTPEILTITSPTDSTTQAGNPFPGDPNGFCSLYPWACANFGTGVTNFTGYGGINTGGLPLNIFCQQHPELCGINPTPPVVTPPPTPTPPPANNKCTMIAPFLGATPYAYTSLGTQLQSVLLLDNPHSIPALDNSLHPNGTVPMGFFGVQTHAALNAYNTMYHCV